MSHLQRPTFAGVLVMLAAVLMTGCSHVATKSIEAERAKLHREPLGMSAKGRPDASIDASGSVKIGSRTLALTDAQRNTARLYRDAVIDLTDLALDEASQSTRHIVIRSLFAVVTGHEEAMEKKIDDRMEAMTHSPAFCSKLDTVQQRQKHLVKAVGALKPYAKFSRREIEDCLAERPCEARL